MDLFTYLLARKNKNSLLHKGDLFSYLLGIKAKGKVKTASGIIINLSDVTHKKIENLNMTKESTQDGTPSPSNPVEIKTVNGNVDIKITGKNLIGNSNMWEKGDISSAQGGINVNANNYVRTIGYIKVLPNTNYYFNYENDIRYSIYLYKNDKTFIGRVNDIQLSTPISFTTPNNAYFIRISTRKNPANTDITSAIVEEYKYQLEKGEATSYEPYKESTVTIPLNDNEIVGKGVNLDELIINKNGHCFINKRFAKIDSYNGETITTDYWSTTGGLDTGATVYYALETPQLINLNYTVDISLYKPISNVSNSDNMYMVLKYY